MQILHQHIIKCLKYSLFFYLILPSQLIGQDITYSHIPKSKTYDVIELTNFLIKNATNDSLKVNVIYQWITHHIQYDIKSFVKIKNKFYTPNQILTRRKGGCQQYADLFQTMCEIANLKCIKVQGYVKSIEYEKGDRFFIDEHVWNAVEINGQWYYIDATWGSGFLVHQERPIRQFLFNTFRIPFKINKLKFVQPPNNRYLFTHPQIHSSTHLSLHPMWQLDSTLVNIEIFEEKPTQKTTQSNQQPYNYKNTIQHYFSLKYREKEIFIAKGGQKFNHKNHHELARASFNYGSYFLKEDTDTSTFYFNKAISEARLYKKEVEIFYKEKKNQINLRYKKIIDFNSKLRGQNKSFLRSYRRKIRGIKKANRRLYHSIYLTYYRAELSTSDNMEKINRPIKIRKHYAKLIEKCNMQITENKKRIQKAIEINENLLFDTILHLNNTEKAYFQERLQKKAPIKMYIDVNTKLNINNNLFELIEANQKIIAKYLRDYDSLKTKNAILRRLITKAFKKNDAETIKAGQICKNTKNLIIQIKKSSIKPQGENEKYAEINESHLVLLIAFADKYKEKLAYNLFLKGYLKSEKRIIRKQQKFLRKEKRVAKLVRKSTLNYLKYKYKYYISRGNKIEKKAKNVISKIKNLK